MKWQFVDKATQGKLILRIHDQDIAGKGMLDTKKEMFNTIVYNPGEAQLVTIDNIQYTLPPDSMLPLVANQTFRFEEPEKLVAWQFNRDFYCIVDHDSEVGCVGFLFYGINHPFFIRLSSQEKQHINFIQQQCIDDMQINDSIQGEMLRTLLKQLIINLTRLARKQCCSQPESGRDKIDTIRKFSLLLEINYRQRHEVRFYASTMNIAPKTLTNLLLTSNYPPPSELIRQRIILEAKRYLYYTDKLVKEVAEELGFASTAHFSRFFKAATGKNFSAFKNPEMTSSITFA